MPRLHRLTRYTVEIWFVMCVAAIKNDDHISAQTFRDLLYYSALPMDVIVLMYLKGWVKVAVLANICPNVH